MNILSIIFGFGLVGWLFLLVSGFFIGALCWTYVINTWLLFFEKMTTIHWFAGGLIGLVPGLGYFGLIAAVFTWIVMLFLM